MGTLESIPLEGEDVLQGFDCGNASVNALVAESFYPHLLKQSRTYQVKLQNQTVGFYSLSVRGVSLLNSDAPVAEFYFKEPSFGAICLDYLAVDARIHGRGIGSAILHSVITQARELAKDWPIRLFVLDALREKVSWYRDRGFDALIRADLDKKQKPLVCILISAPKRSWMHSGRIPMIFSHNLSQEVFLCN